MNERVQLELNKQINAELSSAYLYLSMSAYLSTISLDGFAKWMRMQFDEEQAHAMKLYDYVIERGGNVELQTIDAPQIEWKNIIDVFEHTLAHEKNVTSLINELTSIAQEEKDYATVNALQWFVTEQVEEEATASRMLDQLKLINGEGPGLFMLDREAGARDAISVP